MNFEILIHQIVRVWEKNSGTAKLVVLLNSTLLQVLKVRNSPNNFVRLKVNVDFSHGHLTFRTCNGDEGLTPYLQLKLLLIPTWAITAPHESLLGLQGAFREFKSRPRCLWLINFQVTVRMKKQRASAQLWIWAWTEDAKLVNSHASCFSYYFWHLNASYSKTF